MVGTAIATVGGRTDRHRTSGKRDCATECTHRERTVCTEGLLLFFKQREREAAFDNRTHAFQQIKRRVTERVAERSVHMTLFLFLFFLFELLPHTGLPVFGPHSDSYTLGRVIEQRESGNPYVIASPLCGPPNVALALYSQ